MNQTDRVVKTQVAKKIRLDLQGLDGNALCLLAMFGLQARREGWSDDEINAVRTEATRGDYDHLLQVLIAHTR